MKNLDEERIEMDWTAVYLASKCSRFNEEDFCSPLSLSISFGTDENKSSELFDSFQ